MANMDEFVAILHEIDSNLPSDRSMAMDGKINTKTASEPPKLLSVEHVTTAISDLTRSSITNDLVKSRLTTVPVEDLTKSLEWLNMCLVNKRLMMAAAVDKVWRTYHSSVQEHLQEMGKVTSSTLASVLLSLYVMKALIKENYYQPNQRPVQDSIITERDIEILTYISGFLIRRYRHLPEAQGLCTTHSTGVTAAFDRGGLMNPRSEFVGLVTEMEEVFRALPTKSVDRADFQKTLCERDLPSNLFELLQDVESPTEKKEQFYSDLCNLFFTIRAHQKCRHFVEQHIKTTHCTRKAIIKL